MTFFLMLVGGIVGAWFCGALFGSHGAGLGLLFGAASGFLFARLRKLRDQLIALQHELAQLKEMVRRNFMQQQELSVVAKSEVKEVSSITSETTSPLTTEIKTEAIPSIATPLIPPRTSTEPLHQPTVAAQSEESMQKDRVETTAQRTSETHLPPPLPSQPTPSKQHSSGTAPGKPNEPDIVSKAFSYLKRWFTEGNVPVKVGVLVLFGGVGALLKYAIDQEWFTFPPELRLAGIAAAALAGLIFAWQKRESHRTFALSLQGGAIGVLMITVFAAFRLYSLLNAPATFILLIILVAGTGALAVLQNSLALAFLGIVGGFLAPILASSGSGNHVALFTYYALLNAAILFIAWIKPWRVLNLTGFAFTFAIGTAWGILKYQPEFFSTTQPFLVLYFLFYLAIPILYALRQPLERRGFVDATVVFGTPLLAFPLQVGLLQGDKMQLAYSALGVAVIYSILAWFLLKKWSLRLLGESHALLALGFATLAVPLAFSARSTACAWALEGAALVWLGLRQQRRIQRWIGYFLQLLAGCAFLWGAIWYGQNADDLVILNGEFLSTLLISLSGFTTIRLLNRANCTSSLANLWFGWGLAWWILTGCHEIERFVPDHLESTFMFGFTILTAWLAAELFRRLDWRECIWPASALYPLAFLFIPLIKDENHGTLESFGALIWTTWLLAALRILACVNSFGERWVAVLHFIFLWTAGLVLSTEFVHLTNTHFALTETWVALAGFAPLGLLFWLTLHRLAIARFPVDMPAEKHRNFFLGSLAFVLGAAAFLGLFAEGNASPLPYIPFFNPLELTQISLLLLFLRWYQQASTEGYALLPTQQRAGILALLSFILLTSITLRSVHFFGEVPWSPVLFQSSLSQASLSVVWSLAGITAMLIGAKRNSRSVWIGGAVLMGIVIGKLIVIDRHHLRDLSAILSVLTVGLLLLAVGYFAPVPPRRTEEKGAI